LSPCSSSVRSASSVQGVHLENNPANQIEHR
jgi:hypothetical protein